jgi:hypothetical protein
MKHAEASGIIIGFRDLAEKEKQKEGQLRLLAEVRHSIDPDITGTTSRIPATRGRTSSGKQLRKSDSDDVSGARPNDLLKGTSTKI